jgi:hypothetical protein
VVVFLGDTHRGIALLRAAVSDLAVGVVTHTELVDTRGRRTISATGTPWANHSAPVTAPPRASPCPRRTGRRCLRISSSRHRPDTDHARGRHAAN